MLGSIIKAVVGGNAANKAASIQDQAAQRAADASLAQYQQTRTDLEPYRTAGTQSLGRLSDLLGISGNTGAQGFGSLTKAFGREDFEADPGYQFRLDEGMKALERSQAARFGLFSGQAMKEATRFGQNTATDEFDRAYNRFRTNQNDVYGRLSDVTNLGQNAATQTGSFGAAATNAANDARMSGAAARAAGTIGSANSWINAITEIETNGQRAAGMAFGVPSSQPGTFFSPQEMGWGTGLRRR